MTFSLTTLRNIISLFLLTSFSVGAFADPSPALLDDLKDILRKANFQQNQIAATFTVSPPAPNANSEINSILVKCDSSQHVWLDVRSKPSEVTSTFYYGLHKLGFLFPHPRVQISPTWSAITRHCNETFKWRPSIAVRGFHLHTQHPNEWVSGFFTGPKLIGVDTVLWLARNFQNVFELELLRGPVSDYARMMSESLKLAHQLGMRVGLAVSFSMLQQKSYYLLPPWKVLFNYETKSTLESSTLKLLADFQVDFLTVEIGTTEFTPTSYAHTLEWLNELGAILIANKKFLMAKVHASTNQFDEEHGNFNFTPHYADLSVGVLPHTVYFYDLTDDNTPIYGRKNFDDILKFMIEENPRRETWYFAETSYFVGMDIDVPLFLTDYLRARALDYKKIAGLNIKGHLTFSSGQEMGYWLFDWNTALQANSEYLGDELVGLRLLGEDLAVWQKIINFQTQYFKKNQLIQVLTAENLLDELPLFGPIHDRILIRDLFSKETFLTAQIRSLEDALTNAPPATEINEIKNTELRRMIQVTFLRMQHALYIRKAIADRRDASKKSTWLNKAMQVRESALGLMQEIEKENQHYPESIVYSRIANPTSYGYGYGWSARTLYFWEREEGLVAGHAQNPFYHNLYDPLALLF
jgi:hypothetical protein